MKTHAVQKTALEKVKHALFLRQVGYNGGSKKMQLATTKSQIISTKPRMMVTVKLLLAF